jgi:hypothetical protein
MIITIHNLLKVETKRNLVAHILDPRVVVDSKPMATITVGSCEESYDADGLSRVIDVLTEVRDQIKTEGMNVDASTNGEGANET